MAKFQRSETLACVCIKYSLCTGRVDSKAVIARFLKKLPKNVLYVHMHSKNSWGSPKKNTAFIISQNGATKNVTAYIVMAKTA